MDVICGSPSSSSFAIHQPDPKSLLLFFSRSKKSDGRRKAALTAASSSPCVVVLGRKVHMHFDKGAAVPKGEPATCSDVVISIKNEKKTNQTH